MQWNRPHSQFFQSGQEESRKKPGSSSRLPMMPAAIKSRGLRKDFSSSVTVVMMLFIQLSYMSLYYITLNCIRTSYYLYITICTQYTWHGITSYSKTYSPVIPSSLSAIFGRTTWVCSRYHRHLAAVIACPQMTSFHFPFHFSSSFVIGLTSRAM